ncbi:cytochrome C [Pseudomonas sp. DY-1]|uniref:cytochrome C n=1 Tax=Pseudomonas sp. DY-1 TaxID=1755504 RepID=UPI00211396F4|nr:cytochrome C [Pseudomonas sp. DY-1]
MSLPFATPWAQFGALGVRLIRWFATALAFLVFPTMAESDDVARGRYLIQVSGCNDCHTAGWMESSGQVAEGQWLTGSPLGWRGPWGTTYASNLRLVAQNLSEAQWLEHARREWRPPMPWFNLRRMEDRDLTAIFHYIRNLGPAGSVAPAYVPPGHAPQMPYAEFPGVE